MRNKIDRAGMLFYSCLLNAGQFDEFFKAAKQVKIVPKCVYFDRMNIDPVKLFIP